MDSENISRLKMILAGNDYVLKVSDNDISLSVKYYPVNIKNSTSVDKVIKLIIDSKLLVNKIAKEYSVESFNRHRDFNQLFFQTKTGEVYRTNCNNRQSSIYKDVSRMLDDYNTIMSSLGEEPSKNIFRRAFESDGKELYVSFAERDELRKAKVEVTGIGFDDIIINKRDPNLLRWLYKNDLDYITKKNNDELNRISNEFFENLRVLNERNSKEYKHKNGERTFSAKSNLDDPIKSSTKTLTDALNHTKGSSDKDMFDDISVNTKPSFIKINHYEDLIRKHGIRFIDTTPKSQLGFDAVIETRVMLIKETLQSKVKEYASEKSRFQNFVDAGRMKNETPEKALYGIAVKHFVSVKKIVDDIESKGKYPSIEILNEKIGDSINYHILLEGLIK